MEFEGQLTVSAGKDELWNLVSDPEILALCVPGASDVEKLSETKYRGTIERSVAGISLNMIGEVEITDLNAPDSLSATATGEDAKTNSQMNATADMTMADHGNDKTELSYHVDMEFTGRLATLGARIVKRKINSDIKTFFSNIKDRAESD